MAKEFRVGIKDASGQSFRASGGTVHRGAGNGTLTVKRPCACKNCKKSEASIDGITAPAPTVPVVAKKVDPTSITFPSPSPDALRDAINAARKPTMTREEVIAAATRPTPTRK